MRKDVFNVGFNCDEGVWSIVTAAAKARGVSRSVLVRMGLRSLGVPLPPDRPQGRPKRRLAPASPPPTPVSPINDNEVRVRIRTRPATPAVSA